MPDLPRRRLGSSDLEITPVGLGTAPIGSHPSWSVNWGRQDEAEAIRTVQAAIEGGINWIDTAPFYGWGRAETIVGRAIRGRRDRILLFTKCGTINDGSGGDFMDLSPLAIRKDIEESLRRLGVDHVDLLQLHDPDPNVPIEVSWEAVQQLIKEGKVRQGGLSNHDVPLLKRAMAVGTVVASQNRYNLLARDLEQEILPFCLDRGVGVLSWSSLAEGLLTDGFDPALLEPNDFRHEAPLFQGRRYADARTLVDKLSPLAKEAGMTIAQLAVAWLLGKGVSGAIVGARTVSEANELAASGALSAGPELLRNMDRALEVL